MTHTTVGTLRKKAELIKKQPEANDDSDRQRFKKNRQFREVERKNPNDQVIPYGQKLYKILVK